MLHKKYADVCYVIAYRYLQIHEDAEEKVIDTFMSAYKHLSDFHYEKEGMLKSWLKKVCINHCLQQIRKKKKFLIEDINNLQIVDNASHADHMNYEELVAMLQKLPEIQKLVFQLYEIDGYSHAEIAEQLSMSVGTSKSYLHRAKTALKIYLTQENY